MEKDKLFEYIDHPEQLDAVSLQNLVEIVGEYPYFQTARLLLVKNLKNVGHYRYDSELKLSATYAGNRSNLYWLINDLKRFNDHLNPVNTPKLEDNYQSNTDQTQEDKEKEKELELPYIHSAYQINIGEKNDLNLKELINDIKKSAKQSKKVEEKKKTGKLLDDFISANPGKIEPNETLSNEVDHSIAEVRESEGFLSEKLAAIYARQGHEDKAISMYQKLAENIPEKKEEFLQKIKELEQKEGS